MMTKDYLERLKISYRECGCPNERRRLMRAIGKVRAADLAFETGAHTLAMAFLESAAAITQVHLRSA